MNIPSRLIDAGRPFLAYRFHVAIIEQLGVSRVGDSLYNASCVAAFAGTGQGMDAPPPAERPAIRKHALEWLNTDLDRMKKDVAALPVFGASSVGLLAFPCRHGPLLLAISAIAADSPNAAARYSTIHKGMTHWLSDPDFAGVRDDQWLAKLPADEQGKWRKLWAEVRSLRDRTAPRKTAPPVGKLVPVAAPKPPASK